MFNLLKNIYNKFETYKGAQLYKVIALSFIIFLVLGLVLGFVFGPLFSGNKDSNQNTNLPTAQPDTFIEGRISYIDPNFYPQDNISYILRDSAGKDIILLKAKDQKLVVAEGQFAKVYGVKEKTMDGQKDVLLVDKIVINNR